MRWIGIVCASWVLGPACLAAGNGEADDVSPDNAAGAALEVTPEGEVGGGPDVASPDDVPPPSDAAPGDVTPSTGGPTPVPCASGPLGARGVVVFDERMINMAPVVFDGATLVGSRARYPDSDDPTSDLVRVALTSGHEQRVTPEDDVLMALDGRDGGVLYARMNHENAMNALQFMDSAGATTTLFERDTPGFEPPALWPQPFGWQEPVRQVERGLVVWSELVVPPPEQQWQQFKRVMAARDGGVVELWRGPAKYLVGLHVRAGRAAWMRSDAAPLQAMVADLRDDLAAAPRTFPAADNALSFTLTDDALWWVTMPFGGGRIMRLDLATEEVREAHPGPCLSLTADATRVMSVCGEGPLLGQGSQTWVGGGQPVVLDGVRTLALAGPSPDDIMLGAMAIEGDRAVWVEYAARVLTVGEACRAEPGDGVLKLAQLDGDHVASVTPLGALDVGCWCCHNDGYWPRPDVRLTRDGIAWNYPLTTPLDTRDDGRTPVGWLLFDATCAP